eukprot:TRINITY_DN77525_c0_g1_i1.p1 TRINITY_DN77525_c0_g1~~TRINITY_DN77525_c0_g1_i1.p1  ORF type:complete len:451 (-),score=89.26 TRINITY_DN77525_c0_g1_i1:16-1347(-)
MDIKLWRFAVLRAVLALGLAWQACGVKLNDVQRDQELDSSLSAETLDFSNDETSCKIVSSRGILKSADVRPKPLQSSAKTVDAKHYISGMKAAGKGALVYVVTSALGHFMDKVLPNATKPFVLLSGDSDSSPAGGADGGLGERWKELAENSLIIKWFSQNVIEDHPKLVRMPIGLDFHTQAQYNLHGPVKSPKEQEAELLTLRAQGTWPFKARRDKVFIGGITGDHRGALRKQASLLLAEFGSGHKDRVDGAAGEISRREYWTQVAGDRYSASPASRGTDCHRTWEILALGGVPIVSKTNLNRIFKDNGLAAVEVNEDEWSDPGAEIAAQMKDDSDLLPKKDQLQPALTLRYWVEKFRAAAVEDKCTELYVGPSLDHSQKSVTLQASTYICPREVSSSNWIPRDIKVSDRFAIKQEGTSVVINRADRAEGWGLDLRFTCCEAA